jgi:hypothetical protein
MARGIETIFRVIPAKAGIQFFSEATPDRDPPLSRGDGKVVYVGFVRFPFAFSPVIQ